MESHVIRWIAIIFGAILLLIGGVIYARYRISSRATGQMIDGCGAPRSGIVKVKTGFRATEVPIALHGETILKGNLLPSGEVIVLTTGTIIITGTVKAGAELHVGGGGACVVIKGDVEADAIIGVAGGGARIIVHGINKGDLRVIGGDAQVENLEGPIVMGDIQAEARFWGMHEIKEYLTAENPTRREDSIIAGQLVHIARGGALLEVMGDIQPQGKAVAQGGGACILVRGDVADGAQLTADGGGSTIIVLGVISPKAMLTASRILAAMARNEGCRVRTLDIGKPFGLGLYQ